MKRQITGLHGADRSAADQIPDGIFLVQVQRAKFQRQAQKPYYTLTLAILEPGRFAEHVISSRLYCSPKALWKLNWFLRDFGYDTELLGRDEVDESRVVSSRCSGCATSRSPSTSSISSAMPSSRSARSSRPTGRSPRAWACMR